jgi:hypothetical protein
MIPFVWFDVYKKTGGLTLFSDNNLSRSKSRKEKPELAVSIILFHPTQSADNEWQKHTRRMEKRKLTTVSALRCEIIIQLPK